MNSDHIEAASGSLRKPTHEELSVAAYQVYEEEGCPSGVCRIALARRRAPFESGVRHRVILELAVFTVL